MAEQKVPESILVIDFAAPASTMFQIGGEGVTPEQFVLAGVFLITRGVFIWWDQFRKQVEAIRESQIVVPGLSPEQVAEMMRGVKGGD